MGFNNIRAMNVYISENVLVIRSAMKRIHISYFLIYLTYRECDIKIGFRDIYLQRKLILHLEICI